LVDCFSSFSGVSSLLHARGAATEKAQSPIRRRISGTTSRQMHTSAAAAAAGEN